MTRVLFWRFVNQKSPLVNRDRDTAKQLGNRLGRYSLLGVRFVLDHRQLCSVLCPQAEIWNKSIADIDGNHLYRNYRNSFVANAFCIDATHLTILSTAFLLGRSLLGHIGTAKGSQIAA